MTERVSWHPAFCRAMEIELSAWKEYLEYQSEFELSKEPLLVDLLIIKKTADITIDKPIGRIFKTHNLLEYKSPTGTLTISDFYKVLSYSCQYKAIYTGDIIPDEEITITFICDHKPKKLINYLNNTKKWPVEHQGNGIYSITGFMFSIQLIVRPELNSNENFFLKCLTNNIDIEMLERAIDEDDAHKEDNTYQEFFSTIYLQNADILLEVISMKTVTPELMEKFERVANDTGLAQKLIIKGETRGEARGEARGKALGIAEGEKRGRALGVTEGKALGVTEGETKAKIEAARSLLDLLTDKVISERLELPLATVVALHKK